MFKPFETYRLFWNDITGSQKTGGASQNAQPLFARRTVRQNTSGKKNK